jgi:hypothetical protein
MRALSARAHAAPVLLPPLPSRGPGPPMRGAFISCAPEAPAAAQWSWRRVSSSVNPLTTMWQASGPAFFYPVVASIAGPSGEILMLPRRAAAIRGGRCEHLSDWCRRHCGPCSIPACGTVIYPRWGRRSGPLGMAPPALPRRAAGLGVVRIVVASAAQHHPYQPAAPGASRPTGASRPQLVRGCRALSTRRPRKLPREELPPSSPLGAAAVKPSARDIMSTLASVISQFCVRLK